MTSGDLLSLQVTHDRRSRSWWDRETLAVCFVSWYVLYRHQISQHTLNACWTWLGSEYNLLFSHHSFHPTLYRKRKPLPLSLNTLILSSPSLSTFSSLREFFYIPFISYTYSLTLVRYEVSYGNLGSHFKSNSLKGAVPLAIQWRRLWQGRWRKDLE